MSKDIHNAASTGDIEGVQRCIKQDRHAVNIKDMVRDSPLHKASEGGHLDVTKALLQAGADLDAKNWGQDSPINIAAEKGHYEVVKTLIQAGADANAKNKDQDSSLHIAAVKGHHEVVKTLIQAGADANAKNKYLKTPLHYAAKGGCNTIVESLIRAGADVNVEDEKEKTPLLIATENGDVDIVKTLIKAGADVDFKDLKEKALLLFATENGDIDIIETLIKAGADVDIWDRNGETSLHLAAKMGHIEVVETLIEVGADINKKGWDDKTSLHLAADLGHIEVVKTLIEVGADVNRKDRGDKTSLHLAADQGHIEVVKTLIEAGADIDVEDWNGRTSLLLAAEKGHVEVVKILIEVGADVNRKDRDYKTSLHLAAEKGQIEVVKTLIEGGADVNRTDWDDKTSLQLAADHGQIEVIKTLIEVGTDVNRKDRNGWTLLHFAADEGKIEVVKTLIEGGADVKRKDRDHWTSLHLAADKGHIEVVKTLIEVEADVNRKGWNDWTSLHLAAEKGHVEVVKTLIERGADVNMEDSIGRTSLHLAADEGHMKVVTTLIEGGADVNRKDRDGKTAKQLANSRIRKVFQEFENASKRVPKEIRMLGPSATARYLSALEKDSAVSNVIRVMLVGHFGVGKTTLAMGLLERTVKRIDSTDGIEVYINQCMYDIRAKKWHTDRKYNETLLGFDEVIRLDFVDFAGQLIFYTTHQTYLASRGLYLLVFNLAMGLTKEVCDEDVHLGKSYRRVIDFLEYWIVTIKTYASGEQDDFPKIILVGTHKDKITEEKDLRQIKDEIVAKFHDMVISTQLVVRDDLFISATNMSNETRKSIRDIILEEGRKYQEFGERIPAPWIALQQQLMKLKEEGQYIVPIDQIRKINSELIAPLNDEELDIFLKYLHNIGYILYFSTSVLKQRIILDPKVVIDAMKCFITCARFVKSVSVRKIWNHMRVFGEVKKSHILKLWKGKGLGGHSEHLLAIMKKLDLICEPMIYGRGEQLLTNFFVVPSMINAVEPDVPVVGVPRDERVEIVFSSETLLPPAIFNRLVCSCLALWTIYDKHLYNGLVVLKSGRYHLIQMRRDVNQIIITFAHSEASKRPEIQLCLAVKQFLVETINQIVAVYSTSRDGPISCDASSLNDFLDVSQKATGSHENDDRKNTDSDARETIACKCDAYAGFNLEDVNLMRIAVQLQRVDLRAICTALLNDAEFAQEIENNHQGFDMAVKAFYVLQEWKQQTENFSGTELRHLFENHLENVNIDICKANAEEVLNPGIIDPTIMVSKVYPEYLNAVADKISMKYLHLGLELDLTLEEIERLRMEKSTILEVVRAMLGQWYHEQNDDATVSRLANALFRCHVNKLKWLESEFDTEQIIQREEVIYSESRGEKCSIC